MTSAATLAWDEGKGHYISAPVEVPFLGAGKRRFLFDGGARDEATRLEAQRIVDKARKAGPEVLAAAEPHVDEYCRDMLALFGEGGPEGITLEKPGDVWKYVQIGDELRIEQQGGHV